MDPHIETLEAPASPFLGSGFLADVAAPAQQEQPIRGLVSPFAEALVTSASEEEQLFTELMSELEDESFDDALEALVDEAAALHLSSPWSSESETGSHQLDAWASRLTADAQRLLEHLEQTFVDRSPESILEGEIDLAAARAFTDPVSPAAEQLFGGLVNKIKSGLSKVRQAVTRVATTGLGVIGKFTGIGRITGIVRRLVEPLVRRVVNTALNRLPASLQGPARNLAEKLGARVLASAPIAVGAASPPPAAGNNVAPAANGASTQPPPEAAPATDGAGQELAEAFDRQFAEALTAPSEAAMEQLFAAAAEAAAPSGENPVAALDVARARLAEELSEAVPGEAPVVQVEQFIPAVMAAMPLVRTAVRFLGRGRIKGMIAGPLATFIAPFVGRQAARSLAPHIADAGMRLLRLEHEDPAQLGAEALVSTLEEAVRQVLSLPQQSLSSDLRLAAEVQEAFAEAAARYLPPQVLRSELTSGEAEDGAGWVLMPRQAGPHYRYRAYSSPVRVIVPRSIARAIVYADGETLEERLLDSGVATWPAEAEVQLYEALPGTRVGHVMAGSDPESLDEASADEFAALTPRVAGMLLGNPALGRRPVVALPGSWLRPGQRLFRVVPAGRTPSGVRRRVRRFGVRVVLTGPSPVLRVHLRVGERSAHAIAGQLDQHQHTQVVAGIRELLGAGARRALADRLGRVRGLNTPTPMPAERRQALAEALAESMITAVAKELPAAATAIATAAKDPARGITLTFAYSFPDRAAVLGSPPGAPTLTIRPGFRHD